MEPAITPKSGVTDMNTLTENENGFSLIEVMVASAITLVLVLAAASLMVGVGRQQNNTKEKADWYEFQQQLTADLKAKRP